MYYDINGHMKAAGAEADGAAVLAQAEDEGWIKIELYVSRLSTFLTPALMHCQIQATTTTKDYDPPDERHAVIPIAAQQRGRRCFRRLSVIPLPLHTILHRRHSR